MTTTVKPHAKPATYSTALPVSDDAVTYNDVDPLLVRLAALSEDDPARELLRRRIIEICLPLARHIALRFKGRGESMEDLEQVARIGLLQSINRFDPERGASFMSYAVPTMMGEVRRFFRDRSWSLSVPRSAKENHLRIGPVADELTAKLGRAPKISELATEMNLDRQAVTDALLAGYAYTAESIDAPSASGSDEDRPIVDRIAAEETGYEHVEQALSVKPLLAQLPADELAILRMRFFEEMTQSQIAQRLGCSQMQVSRKLARTLAFLREHADAT
ncbi:MAG: SigB/SigF/SigG family RNA polymerase sigma factor [Nocardiaceae bacterium]|nr:SigB/SigF/SigG family RNA polymerase sigma factor [Nocardiaceae bacterium]